MGSTSATVTRELTMDVLGRADGQTLPVPVVLRYDTADPFAVSAEFRATPTETVLWTFARELMAQGLAEPAGEGDVRICPSDSGADDGVLISLESEDGAAVVRAATAEVVDFLLQSFALCPMGEESKLFDLDAAVNALLGS